MSTYNPFWEGFNYNNYNSLEAQKQKENIDTLEKTIKKIRTILFITVAVIVFISIVTFVIIENNYPQAPNPDENYLDIIVITVFIIFGLEMIALGYVRKHKNRFAATFALQNNLIVEPNKMFPNFVSTIFSKGNNDPKANLIFKTVPESEYPSIYFANWQYTSGSGKEKTTHRQGILVIDLNQNIPNMKLLPNINKTLGFINKINSNTLTLPAGVDNYFTGHNVTGTENDFYYIFAPDVLNEIINYAVGLEIHLENSKLIFLKNEHFDVYLEDTWKQLEALVQNVAKQVLEQTTRWSKQ